MENKIFISYSHSDKSKVMPIFELLSTRYNVWNDESLTVGDRYDDEIFEHILNCDVCIFMRSPNSLNSDYCRKEIKYALKKGKKFFAIVIEDSKLPPWYEGLFSDIEEVFYTDQTQDFYTKISSVSRILKGCERVDYIPSEDELHSSREVKKKLDESDKRRKKEEKVRKATASREKKLEEKRLANRSIEEAEENIKKAEAEIERLKKDVSVSKKSFPTNVYNTCLSYLVPIFIGLFLTAAIIWAKDFLQYMITFYSLAGALIFINILMVIRICNQIRENNDVIFENVRILVIINDISMAIIFLTLILALLVASSGWKIFLFITCGIAILAWIIISSLQFDDVLRGLKRIHNIIKNYKKYVKIQKDLIKENKKKILNSKATLAKHFFVK